MKTKRHRAIKKADQYLIKSNRKQSEKVVRILSEAADKSEMVYKGDLKEHPFTLVSIMAKKLMDAFSGTGRNK